MKKIIIIAEAGVNHNGNLSIAKKMISVAADAGVDYIKFQTFNTDLLVSKSAPKANYQINNTRNAEGVSQYKMLKKLELSADMHKKLIEICKKKKIKFLSTAFDLKSVDLLRGLGINIFKIPSGELTNLPYIRKIGLLKKSVILSTGMANMEEIKEAISILIKSGTTIKNITVLHCNTEYPTPMRDVNLKAMLTIRDTFSVNVGYSDHTLGIEVAVAAAALGATVIEKHFTLDKHMSGPDHKSSLEPKELKEMVKNIRNIEIALGDGVKLPSKSEIKNITPTRKSIHISSNLKKGHILTEKDLIMKRPGNGISPMKLNEILGKKTIIDLKKSTQLQWDDIQ